MLPRLTALLMVLASATANATLIEYQSSERNLLTADGKVTDITFQHGFTVETDPIHPDYFEYSIKDFWVKSSHFNYAGLGIDNPFVFLNPDNDNTLFILNICCFKVEKDGVQYGVFQQAGEIFQSGLTPAQREDPIWHLDQATSMELRFNTAENESAFIADAFSYRRVHATVPAPAPLGLLALGLAAIGLRRRIL